MSAALRDGRAYEDTLSAAVARGWPEFSASRLAAVGRPLKAAGLFAKEGEIMAAKQGVFLFDLGDKVRDQVTGAIGVIESRSEFLNGCVRYGLSRKGKDDTFWVDEQQLALVKRHAFVPLRERVLKAAAAARRNLDPAGPRPAPQRQADPRR